MSPKMFKGEKIVSIEGLRSYLLSSEGDSGSDILWVLLPVSVVTPARGSQLLRVTKP